MPALEDPAAVAAPAKPKTELEAIQMQANQVTDEVWRFFSSTKNLIIINSETFSSHSNQPDVCYRCAKR